MAVINTTSDLLKALRENPEWKDAVRAEILGERLQTLPELVSENTRQIASIGDKLDRVSTLLAALTERMDRVDAQIAALTERMDRVDAQIAALTERMDRVDAQIAALTERMDRVDAQIAALTERMDRVENRLERVENRLERVENRLERVENRLERVENRLERVENRLGKMDGRHLESDILANPRSYIRRRDLSAVRSLSYDERYELSSQLEESEEEELDLLDAILEGETPTGERVYIAVEASVTIEAHDLERAKRRASFLAKATKTPVLPLVVGDEPPSQGRIDEASSQQVAIARKQRGIVVNAPFLR
jgi:chromosome segregation ATPase